MLINNKRYISKMSFKIKTIKNYYVKPNYHNKGFVFSTSDPLIKNTHTHTPHTHAADSTNQAELYAATHSHIIIYK